MKSFYAPILLFLFVKINGQSLANYLTVRNTGVSYLSISGTGNSFSSWRNTVSNTQDDNRSDLTNIGFDFWYDGVRYTQFSASTNGFIDFSTSTSTGGSQSGSFSYDNTAFTNFNTANATRPAIAPFYDDLTAQGNIIALGTALNYFVSGIAPNRTLTIEWLNMSVYQNVSPSLNFQVKLVESTGVILINYGTMNSGTNTFSYSMGLNGPTLSLFPTTAELKELQTANGNSFSNTSQNNLSAMPAANSQYVFTPPVPTAVSGNLTFSGVSQTAMTLNWSNWASNEVGYVIYNSTDGINYTFVSQTAANVISYAATSLLPSTLYYWRVYAVTEGCLSSPLNASQTTLSAGNKISITTGNWGTATTWSPTGVPTAGDNVTIANSHVVSINVDGQCNNLTIGQGALATLSYNGFFARTLSVNSNITVNSNAIFNINTTSNVTHSLVAAGNIINSGTIDMATDANSLCNASFSKNGNQTISGAGSNNFNRISIDLGSNITNTLEISAASFSAAANFLDLLSGTFKISTINTVNVTPFTSAYTIPLNAGMLLNSANLAVSTSSAVTLYGNITVSSGTLNIGSAANQDFVLTGGAVSVLNGALNVAGKLDGSDINNPCTFNVSGGIVTVAVYGSTNTSIAPFHIMGAGSVCNLLGGTVVIEREGGTGTQHLGFTNIGASGASILGGTLQIGNAATPSAQIIDINTDAGIGNLLVNSSNATARLNTNALNVQNNIGVASGTLNANNLGMTLGGSWTDAGSFTPGTAGVTFSSSSAQSIFKSGGETFNHLYFSGSGIKTFSCPVTAGGNFSVSAGSSVDVSTSNFSLTVKGNLTNNGMLNVRSALVTLNGTASQSIGGSIPVNFYDLTLNNTAGAILTGAENLLGTLSLNNGTFNANAQLFTMVSTATATARIAQITGSGDITGNVTVQRYMPGGSTGWALIGNPISSALTLNDWDDNLIISCPTCPDGYSSAFTSIYTYDETVNGTYDNPNSYIAISSINDVLSTTKAYWVYLGNAQYTTTPITLDVTGTVKKFNNNIPINYTNTGSAADDGWNLISNPYPSAISWTALRGSTANIDNAIYVYNADLNSGSGAFASYVNGISSPAVASGGVADNIPMFQGFYVHSTGATALSATESNKVNVNPTFLKPNNTSNTTPLLRINLQGANSFMDETVLYFQQGAANNFDQAYDAYKMRGQDPLAPSIALESGTDVFQVNGISPVIGNYTSLLKTLTGYSGTYTLSASNISSFPNGACINLYDRFTSVSTDLRSSDYTFNLADTTSVSRFILSITINSLSVSDDLRQPSCKFPASGRISAVGNGQGPWNYYWTSNGMAVQTSLNKFTADSIYNLSTGTFDLEMNTVGLCDNSQTSYLVNQQLAVAAAFNSLDTVLPGAASLVQFYNTSINASSSYWDFGTGQDFSTASSPAFNYSNAGNYQVSLVATSTTGCKDTTGKLIVVLDEATAIKNSNAQHSQFIVKAMDDRTFMVQAEFGKIQNVNARLSDAQGKLMTDYGTSQTDTLNLKIDLSTYARGIYFLSIVSDNAFKKVVKLVAE